MLATKSFLIFFSVQLLVILGNFTIGDPAVDRIGLLSFKSQITTAKENAYVFTSWNDSTETCSWFGVTCDDPLHPDRVTSLVLPSLNLAGKMSSHLSNLSFLRKIDLGYNSLGGDIPPEIANLHRLRTLNLTSNSLQGEIPGVLFTNLPELQILTLDGNKLHGQIPRNFTQVSKLEVLILKDNNLTGVIPPEWGAFTNLQLLSLRNNNLTGHIPPSIGNITTLNFLFLSENNLVGSIPSQISSCTNLYVLDLLFNQLSGQIPPSLFNFSSLYTFGVGGNLLDGTLPSDFGRNFPQLGNLYLYDNKFSGQIPPSLSEATELERIELSGNGFNGSIPPNLGSRLPNLSKLILGDNLLSTDDWRFVDSLTNCSYLEELDLSNNSFTGMLPESITKLSATTLAWLRLRNNKIMGEIPCSSILSTETVVRSIPTGKLSPDTIVADVLSVKQFPRNLFLEVLPEEFGIVCTHPMFGPESGKNGWGKLPFVYDKVRLANANQARKCEQFLSIFESEGCRMVEMSSEEHDRHAAGTQFITHTIGRILSHLDLESTPINTKGYETLLELTENTVSDSFDLYYGLFMYNVNATEQIDNLDRAFETVKQKLFARLHDILRKQIVERVPMNCTEEISRSIRSKNKASVPYFLPSSQNMSDISSFSKPAPPQTPSTSTKKVITEDNISSRA